MKKILPVFLLLLTLFSVHAPAIFAATATNVEYNAYYISYRNEYRLDYWSYPAGAASIHVKFVNDVGTVWESDFDASTLTGIFYLTCTGTYDYIFQDGTGAEVGAIRGIATNQIVNGSCQSYAGGTVKDDLGLTSTANADGSQTLTWNPQTGASSYEIYKDGALIDTVTSPPANVPGPGSYTVRAVDGTGATIGESDTTIHESAGECDGCQLIKDYLNCPEWGAYMGEWSQMIKDSVPPAPDWDSVAATMRDTIVPALADELQSREKPVEAPTPLPTFSPSVPTLTDISEKQVTDLTYDVPSFEPDYSGSAPVILSDPLDWTPDDSDKEGGYVLPANPDLTSPAYTKVESSIQPDPGYTVTNPTATAPAPAYAPPAATSSPPPPPTYTTNQAGTDPAPAYQTSGGTTTAPAYQTR